MLDALHRAGHRYLKVLFMVALAGSTVLFFIGSAVPKPPALVVILVGGVLGVAIEWSYFVVSCDLTESITRGHKGGIFLNLLYTLAGGVASWFLFTNAALHVGWAPTDDLIGLSRVHWAMILAGLIVLVIFVLSARRKPVQNEMDMSAIARSIEIHMPNAPQAVKMRILASMLTEAAKYGDQMKALQPPTVVEQTASRVQQPVSAPARPQAPRQWTRRWLLRGTKQQPTLQPAGGSQLPGEQVALPDDEAWGDATTPPSDPSGEYVEYSADSSLGGEHQSNGRRPL